MLLSLNVLWQRRAVGPKYLAVACCSEECGLLGSIWRSGRAFSRRLGQLGALLRDATRPGPAHILYFSMTRVERWFYFHTLEPLLTLGPWVIWRTPAACIATVRVGCERYTDELGRDVLSALGRPADRAARWRFRWQHWYLAELDRLPLIQGQKPSPAWARRHLTIVGAVPAGGALLIGPHQSCRRLATLALAGIARPFGGITGRPAKAEDFARLDATLRHVFTRRHLLTSRYYDGGSSPRRGSRCGTGCDFCAMVATSTA